jgi:hypothetical protein
MPVCITGMHRTGTSMVARLLNICGIYLGKRGDLFGPESDNPEGFWENRHIVSINDEILAKLGGAWDLPPPYIKEWEKRQDLLLVKNKASKLTEEFIGHEPWGWKDPRNSLTIPFWTSILPDLRFVICIRNPIEVAISLHKRGYSSNAFGFNLWLIYNQRMLADTSPPQRIITHYESYFINPKKELRRILDFLRFSVSEEIIDQACTKISDSLRHHSIDSSALNEESVPSELIMLYKQLCADAGTVYEQIEKGKL